MGKNLRNFVAVISAIAMILTGLKYSPAIINAATDPTSLTYTELTSGTVTIGYNIVSSDLSDWGDNSISLLDDGATLQMKFSEAVTAENITVTVNDEAYASGAGPVTLIDNGLVKINPAELPNNAYSEIVISSTDNSSADIVIKRGTPVVDENPGEDQCTNHLHFRKSRGYGYCERADVGRR